VEKRWTILDATRFVRLFLRINFWLIGLLKDDHFVRRRLVSRHTSMYLHDEQVLYRQKARNHHISFPLGSIVQWKSTSWQYVDIAKFEPFQLSSKIQGNEKRKHTRARSRFRGLWNRSHSRSAAKSAMFFANSVNATGWRPPPPPPLPADISLPISLPPKLLSPPFAPASTFLLSNPVIRNSDLPHRNTSYGCAYNDGVQTANHSKTQERDRDKKTRRQIGVSVREGQDCMTTIRIYRSIVSSITAWQ